jgi:hypothetical protein
MLLESDLPLPSTINEIKKLNQHQSDVSTTVVILLAFLWFLHLGILSEMRIFETTSIFLMSE